MKTCPDCGERVYSLGCVNCNEPAYIQEQIEMDADYFSESEQRERELPSPPVADRMTKHDTKD